MSQYDISHDQAAAIMAQLDSATRANPDLYFVQTGAGVGTLHVPDDLDGILQHAMSEDALALQRIATLKAYAAAVRYDRETAGVTFLGNRISTDRVSQSMIANAIALLNADSSLQAIKYKGANGMWSDISREAMIAIGVTVGSYVQACFSSEYQVCEGIDAGQITTNLAIEAWNWPQSE